MSEIQNIIKEQFKTLPKVIQDTLLDSHWQEKIRRVVKINNLHIDQGAAIENLVLITMLGIETPEDFVKNAQENAQVDYDQALAISNQVEKEIFSDIRKKLIEATDASGTVAEIDQATNELDRVAADIEKAAKTTPPAKPSLKNKIPADYFDPNKNISAPTVVPTSQVLPIEPIVVPIIKPVEVTTPKASIAPTEPEVIKMSPPAPIKLEEKIEPPTKLPPKPIFNPMPKEIVSQSAPSSVKTDPYREPIA